jgi:transcriptional regulator with XRE-family HTH domain
MEVIWLNHFKELRLQNGYKKQSDLAKVLFVNQTAVSQWERGATTPSPSILVKLSELYGVSTDYLLGVEEIKRTPAPEIGSDYTVGLSENKNATGISPDGKYNDIIELLDKLSPEQIGEVRGYIKRMFHENEAVKAYKVNNLLA